jgi:hypothetical protein
MSRRVLLPIESDKRLSLERARTKLGGRSASHESAAALIEVRRGTAVTTGVVVWGDETSCDVLFEDEHMERVRRAETTPASAAPSVHLTSIARSVQRFALVREGDTLHIDGGSVKIVEKCRWGALVARPDGRIFALGFRRLGQAPC